LCFLPATASSVSALPRQTFLSSFLRSRLVRRFHYLNGLLKFFFFSALYRHSFHYLGRLCFSLVQSFFLPNKPPTPFQCTFFVSGVPQLGFRPPGTSAPPPVILHESSRCASVAAFEGLLQPLTGRSRSALTFRTTRPSLLLSGADFPFVPCRIR